jgi:hypothetical protein
LIPNLLLTEFIATIISPKFLGYGLDILAHPKNNRLLAVWASYNSFSIA